MGLGSPKNTRTEYYLKLKATRPVGAQKETYCHFVVQKNDDGEIITLKPERAVSGFIQSLSHSTYDYEGVQQKVLVVYLVEDKNRYKIDVNIDSMLGRNVANTILTITDAVERLHFRCYDKKNPKDQKVYAKIWIGKTDYKEDGLTWKYQLEEVQDLIKIIPDPVRPGKKLTINHDLNQMLWEKWHALEGILNPHYRALDEVRKGQDPQPVQQKETKKRSVEPSLQEELDNMKHEDYKEPEYEHADAEVVDDGPTDELPF